MFSPPYQFNWNEDSGACVYSNIYPHLNPFIYNHNPLMANMPFVDELCSWCLENLFSLFFPRELWFDTTTPAPSTHVSSLFRHYNPCPFSSVSGSCLFLFHSWALILRHCPSPNHECTRPFLSLAPLWAMIRHSSLFSSDEPQQFPNWKAPWDENAHYEAIW